MIAVVLKGQLTNTRRDTYMRPIPGVVGQTTVGQQEQVVRIVGDVALMESPGGSFPIPIDYEQRKEAYTDAPITVITLIEPTPYVLDQINKILAPPDKPPVPAE